MKMRSPHFLSRIKRRTRGVMIACLIGAGVSFGVTAQTMIDLQRGFARPPDDARIMMRWWWFGPSVTKSELEREMRLFFFQAEDGIRDLTVTGVQTCALPI